jgi:hypothetical protein
MSTIEAGIEKIEQEQDSLLQSIKKKKELIEIYSAYFNSANGMLKEILNDEVWFVSSKEALFFLPRLKKGDSRIKESYERDNKNHKIDSAIEDITIGLYFQRSVLFEEILRAIIDGTSLPRSIFDKLEEPIQKIKSLYLLKNDWDGYGAKKPSKEAISNAIKFLDFIPSAPVFAYPTVEGKVGLDIVDAGKRFEFTVLNKDTVKYRIFTFDDGDSQKRKLLESDKTTAFSEVVKLLS